MLRCDMLASDCRTPSLQAFAVYKAVHFVSDTFSRYTDNVFGLRLGLSVAIQTSWSKRTVMQERLLTVFDRVAKWGALHTLKPRVAVEERR
jgi:hypothetical protein